MSAPQEFRDGCAYAAQQITERITTARNIGIPVTLETVEAIATTFAHEMGGFVDRRTLDIVDQIKETT